MRSEWRACTITKNTAGGVNQVCVCVYVCVMRMFSLCDVCSFMFPDVEVDLIQRTARLG